MSNLVINPNLTAKELIVELHQRYPNARGHLAEAIMLLEGYYLIIGELHEFDIDGHKVIPQEKCGHCGSAINTEN